MLSGVAASQIMSGTEYEAKRYLKTCLIAVTATSIQSPDGLKASLNGSACDNPAFALATYFDGKTSSPAVARSRVEIGSFGG